LHFYTKYIKRIPTEPTEAQKFGAMVHLALLEPKEFMKRMVTAPEVDQRTKAGKEEWLAFQAGLESTAVIVTKEQSDQITGMLHSLMDHQVASGLLSQGVAEMSGYFLKDGLLCKVRPDYLRQDGIVIDVKTTVCAKRKVFERQIMTYNYHIQAAWYFDAYESLTKRAADSFIFVAIEKEPPYAVAVYIADPTVIEKGRHEYTRAFEIYKQCLKENRWPGYQTEAEMIGLPYWALFSEEER